MVEEQVQVLLELDLMELERVQDMDKVVVLVHIRVQELGQDMALVEELVQDMDMAPVVVLVLVLVPGMELVEFAVATAVEALLALVEEDMAFEALLALAEEDMAFEA
jgi:hypothetical protein